MTENKRLLTPEEVRDIRINVEIYHKSPAHTLGEENEFIVASAQAQDQKTAEQVYKEIGDELLTHSKTGKGSLINPFSPRTFIVEVPDSFIARLKQGLPPEAGL